MLPKILRIALLLLCFSEILPVCAAADWLPIDSADLKETSEPGAPGAAAVILYREETINNSLSSRSLYWRVKILTEKGRQEWSDIEISYAKMFGAKVGEIKARTIHSD